MSSTCGPEYWATHVVPLRSLDRLDIVTHDDVITQRPRHLRDDPHLRPRIGVGDLGGQPSHAERRTPKRRLARHVRFRLFDDIVTGHERDLDPELVVNRALRRGE